MNNNWKLTTLGELEKNGDANIQTGPFGTVLKASEYSDHGSPVISVGEIRYGYLNVTEDTPAVSEETKNRLPQFVLKKDDIVFGRKGAIDRNSIINDEQEGWFLGSDGIRLRLSENVNSLFVSYQFRVPSIGKWLLQNSSGSVMPSLNQKTLNRLPLWLPEELEQKKIANVLFDIDKKIELNNKINAELEAMAKLIYDYWFVQFDFPSDAPENKGKPYKSSGGKMVYNEALKREIPEGWVDLTLANIIEKSGTGLNPRNNFKLGEGNNYYITIKSINNGRIVFDDKCDRVSDEALAIIDKRSDLQVGDVLFTSIQPVGVTYLLRSKPTNWNINESVFTIRGDNKKITPEFLFMLLSSKELKVFTRQSSTGSIHKGIRHGVLKEFILPYGEKNIIESFSKIIAPTLEKQYLLDSETQKLVELRDWLLPMLMNGQVTVNDVKEK